MSENLAASMKGAIQLLMLQVWSRMSTFAINQVALRFITREVLGIVALEMELLSSTILFLSRESIRMALLRAMKDTEDSSTKKAEKLKEEQERQKAVNLTWVAIAIGLVLSVSISVFFGTKEYSSGEAYNVVAPVFCVAAFLELLSEPMYVIAVNKMHFNLRLRVEGTAVFLKCVTTLGILVYTSKASAGKVDNLRAILAFAIAQVVYSVSLLAGYTFHYLWREGYNLSFMLPKQVILSSGPRLESDQLA
ncbi:Oligosaccharide translocation protein rft1 [Phlyctochytrium bullatum]|nr:Oligosaccharide translocation protein rft1 [Phlyctochytrium bullatum]